MNSWSQPICLWVMVNPSTANATADDHTIRKITGYCRRWDFARFRVVNLYAYRSKDIDLLAALGEGVTNQPRVDIVGPDNDTHIREQAMFASEIIVAWGARGKMPPGAPARIKRVLGILRSGLDERHLTRNGPGQAYLPPIFCIGRTKSGDPKHPLTTPYSAPRVRFED